MAITLEHLKKQSTRLPASLLVYAVQGMGKTSLALECPQTVYLQIAPESPPVGFEPVGFGELQSFAQLKEAMIALYTGEHNFKHVVIDSVTALEPMIWAHVCALPGNNWANIETPGYGKGYMLADEVWREFIRGLDALRRDRGMAVTLLGLADASNHEEPGQPVYKRYDLRLHKRAVGLLTQAVDGVFFINTKVTVKEVESGFGQKQSHVEGGGTRWVFTDGRPAFVAKNRFNMPDQLMLPKGNAWATVARYLPGHVDLLPVDAPAVAVPAAA